MSNKRLTLKDLLRNVMEQNQWYEYDQIRESISEKYPQFHYGKGEAYESSMRAGLCVLVKSGFLFIKPTQHNHRNRLYMLSNEVEVPNIVVNETLTDSIRKYTTEFRQQMKESRELIIHIEQNMVRLEHQFNAFLGSLQS